MKLFIYLLFIFSYTISFAQDFGITADINGKKGAFEGEFNIISKLMLSIGAIVGLLAAIKIYNQWHIGEEDIFKGVSNLALGSLFLIIMGLVIRTIFYGKI